MSGDSKLSVKEGWLKTLKRMLGGKAISRNGAGPKSSLSVEEEKRIKQLKHAFGLDFSAEMRARRPYSRTQTFYARFLVVASLGMGVIVASLLALSISSSLDEVAGLITSLIALDGIVLALVWGSISADLRSSRKQLTEFLWQPAGDLGSNKKVVWEESVRFVFQEIERYEVKLQFIGWTGGISLILTVGSLLVSLTAGGRVEESIVVLLSMTPAISGLFVILGLIIRFIIKPNWLKGLFR